MYVQYGADKSYEIFQLAPSFSELRCRGEGVGIIWRGASLVSVLVVSQNRSLYSLYLFTVEDVDHRFEQVEDQMYSLKGNL